VSTRLHWYFWGWPSQHYRPQDKTEQSPKLPVMAGIPLASVFHANGWQLRQRHCAWLL